MMLDNAATLGILPMNPAPGLLGITARESQLKSIPAVHIHPGPHQHSALMLCLVQVSMSGPSP
jgi:hypothetical protein